MGFNSEFKGLKVKKCYCEKYEGRANTKKQMSGGSINALILESQISDSTLGQVISYPEIFPDLPLSLTPDTWRVSRLGKRCTKLVKKSMNHFKILGARSV